jgi:hypothetical protein
MRVEVRSYRSVFALERRIYHIDTLRLNPSGVPLRGIIYFGALLPAVLAVTSLPIVSWLAAAVPWYFRDLAFPLVAASALTILRLDGRPFHLSAISLIRQRFGARHLLGLEPPRRDGPVWRPKAIVCVADGSEADLRSLRYRGPGVALVCFSHERVEWSRGRRIWARPDLSIHPVGEATRQRPVAIELTAGASLEVSRVPFSGRRASRGR